MSRRTDLRDAIAAGGVVYRRRGDRIEIVLVGRSQGGLWALPKGRPEHGETLPQTAVREVGEETGLEVRIVAEIGFDRYTFAAPAEHARIRKEVLHFLMEPSGGDTSRHDGEYDRVAWFDIADACALLTFPSQREIVERAALLIDSLEAERR